MGVRRLLNLPESLVKGEDQICFNEDFLEFVSGGLFFDTSGDSGAAVAPTDAHGGVVSQTTGGTDNNECYLHTTKEIFLFQAEKPMSIGCRVSLPEANTDDMNFIFGWMDAVGANSIVDDGAGPKGSFSGALFYKNDGQTKLSVIASIGSTKSYPLSGSGELNAGNTLTKTAYTTGATYKDLQIDWMPKSSTTGDLHFFIDGQHVQSIIDFVFTSATEMQMVIGVKAGGSNSEVPLVDRAWGAMAR